jgi:hypothetical protein
MFGSYLPAVVCRMADVLFTLFVFVYVWCCPAHIVFRLCFVFLRLVYSMLPVYLDCPFLIVPSVFSNVYFLVTQLKFIHVATMRMYELIDKIVYE